MWEESLGLLSLPTGPIGLAACMAFWTLMYYISIGISRLVAPKAYSELTAEERVHWNNYAWSTTHGIIGFLVRWCMLRRCSHLASVFSGSRCCTSASARVFAFFLLCWARILLKFEFLRVPPPYCAGRVPQRVRHLSWRAGLPLRLHAPPALLHSTNIRFFPRGFHPCEGSCALCAVTASSRV